MKKLLLLPFAVLLVVISFGQDNQNDTRIKKTKTDEKRQRMLALMRSEEESTPPFNKHSIFGIKLATDGYGLSYEIGKYKTPRKNFLMQIELNEKKHDKEEKLTTGVDIFGQFNQIVYAKLNNFYQLKLGVGEQRIIGTKANKNGIEVSAIYAGGVAIGLQKPYLIDVEENGVRRKENFDAFFKDSSDLIGASGFTSGWGQVKFKPGLHAKTALRFDYGRFHQTIGAIEAGMNIEYYFSDVQQLLFVAPKKLFFNAYVTLLFGKRK